MTQDISANSSLPASSDISGMSGIYAARRRAYMDAIGPNAVALIHSPPEAKRNGDVLHPFRQASDILYLTGFNEPEATLLLRPDSDDKTIMFVRPRDPAKEIWDGRRAGIDGARNRYGADAAYRTNELEAMLPKLLANVDHVYYSLGLDPEFDRIVCGVLAKLRMSERRGRRPPRAVVDPRTVLHEMRLRKSAEEIDLMREAARISVEAHNEAMKAASPGTAEYQLESLIYHIFRKHGGTGPGYNSIVGSGENATILHYIENDRVLQDGDLVLIDAGCEYRGYTADITRTFPAGGRFTEAQRNVYEIVLATQKSAIDMIKPGVSIDDIHEHCVRELTAGLIAIGLLDGTVEQCIEDKSYKQFYMHRTSHWLGMDVHDVGAYTIKGDSRPLEPGMVITVEPGLYIASDADVPDEYRGIGVRIEDDILITEHGYENLTVGVPKDIADVETLCDG